MIDEVVKIHDKFTIEMKVGFKGKPEEEKNRFSINTWFFVPGNLDVNRRTYTKDNFYRDIKSNIRLITPVFSLQDIAQGDKSPFVSINKSLRKLFVNANEHSLKELEYQFKMFNSILKSALREDLRVITRIKEEDQIILAVENYLKNIEIITANFRNLEGELAKIPRFSKAVDFFAFGDEFMSYLIENHSFKLYLFLHGKEGFIKKDLAPRVLNLLKNEVAHKKARNYLLVDKESSDNNRMLILRHGVLKKYSESELYLDTIKKEDAFLMRQFVYSLAAGISMVFATVVAFSFQNKYGNLTIPFFVALVVGYMLKDRIKELSRFYFAHKLNNKYFDVKTDIRIGTDKIGMSKEAFDFVSDERVPDEILKMRNRSTLLEANNKFNEEQILLYRLQVETNNLLLNNLTEYDVSGINNIIRYNIASLTHKMDNPEVPLFFFDEEDKINYVKGDKVYIVNMVVQLQNDSQTEICHYRLVLNRDGIKDILKMA